MNDIENLQNQINVLKDDLDNLESLEINDKFENITNDLDTLDSKVNNLELQIK